MRIARILYPVRVLGPGERIGIWTAGCVRRCRGCANPELQRAEAAREIPFDRLKLLLDRILAEHRVDGVTISGGEPFMPEQMTELCKLIDYLQKFTDDILIYTGYRIENLKKRKKFAEETAVVLNTAALVIDGPYVEDKNLCHPLRGSENQRLVYRDGVIRAKYESYIAQRKGAPEVQNFQSMDGIISVGIHKREFMKQFT